MSAMIDKCLVQNNILFGEKYNDERYRAVIHAACLSQDLLALPVRALSAHAYLLMCAQTGWRQH